MKQSMHQILNLRGRKAWLKTQVKLLTNGARVKALFDQNYYLSQKPDIAKSGMEPFVHYLKVGWKAGLDPSPAFSTRFYLEHSPDVAAAGINPFLHWAFYGKAEKRRTLPFQRCLDLQDYEPKVSVIIPNFNHARFLEQRIESILAQTYWNFDILILDDMSTDESRAVIERYCQMHPERIRKLFNDKNAGNVFKQWRKGIENSSGDLVWICESDDFCEPDFLEKIVRHFKDRSVNLAFGAIQFSNSDGTFLEGMDGIREGAEPGIWQHPITRPANAWFSNGLGINNLIANVGGCVWRRQELSDAIWAEAETFQILGDWFLYMHLAAGGQIAYEPGAVAHFRQHGNNTSVVAFKKAVYYEEHERFMKQLRRRWNIPAETVARFYDRVQWHFDHHNGSAELGRIENYCDKEKLLATKRDQQHILIGFLGFHVGGGEMFPIHIANELRSQGKLVSMMALDMQNVNDEMLGMLAPGIAVYDSSYVAEIGAERFLESAGICLIHSHVVGVEAFFFERCDLNNDIPYLVSLHGSYESTTWADGRRRRFGRGVKHWVYTTDRNLEPLQEMHLPKGALTKMSNAMPNDSLPFPKTREELGIAEEAVIFTLVARGIQRKGWRASIEAFKRLRDSKGNQPMHLLLCGDGPEVENHLAAHRNDPDITFLGYQSRIHGLYRLTDVAIVPTRFGGESFPLCIIQALQTGTPVIATRTGEIGSMIAPEGQDPAGILIEPVRDTEVFIQSLRDAMEDMLSSSRRQNLAAAADHLGSSYSMENTVGRYVELYDSMIEIAR